MADKNIDTVIFDLGGVLVDWNPEYLYRKLFDDEEEMRYFLAEIATPEWNEQQDAGRPLDEATEWLLARHPEYEEAIRAYYGRWEETLGGQVQESVDLLRELHDRGTHRLLALTNWSHETFPVARERFEWLQLFEGILVSGEEKMKKPEARIYRRLIERYDVVAPGAALFIDDNVKNVEGARAVGLEAVHFQSPARLRADLAAWKILPAG